MTGSQEGSERDISWRKRIAMLMGAHVMGTINVVSVLAMAPVIQRALNLSATEFGFVITAYYCGQATWSLPAGVFVDHAGVGRLLMVAMAGIAVGTTIVLSADGLLMLLLGMYLMGSGYSFTNPSTAKGVFDWFPQHRRATAMGAKQTGVPIGGMIAAGLGALTGLVDWRLLLGGVVFATFGFGFSCAVLRDDAIGPQSDKRDSLEGLLVLLRDGNYGRFVFSNLLYNFGQGNFFGFLTLFIRDALQGSQEFASLCLGVAQSVSAVARFGWGSVSDMLFGARRKHLVVGIGILSVVLLIGMSIMEPGWPITLVLLFVGGLGITVASYAGLMQTLSVEAVEPHLTGSAVGYNGIGTHMGAIVGPPIFGTIVDLTGDYSGSWFVTATMVGVGVLLLGFGFQEGGRK